MLHSITVDRDATFSSRLINSCTCSSRCLYNFDLSVFTQPPTWFPLSPMRPHCEPPPPAGKCLLSLPEALLSKLGRQCICISVSQTCYLSSSSQRCQDLFLATWYIRYSWPFQSRLSHPVVAHSSCFKDTQDILIYLSNEEPDYMQRLNN